LSTHLREKAEKILKVLEQIAEESAKGMPIVVEGKNDVTALRTLGIEGKILSAKTGGKSILETVSEIESMELQTVILLLDFDRRGKELTERLKQQLEKIGIHPNLSFWRELSLLVSKEVKDIEGLATYMENLKRKICNS
jgi:2,5-diamino-6-(ribosylamino)-4(3H)-pyrimidinone 5'-phosphate reductase